jgi:hypothetical protein
MTTGLMTFTAASQNWSGPTLAPVLGQFGGTKNFWLDLIIMAVMIGGAVYVVCRSSRRY